MNYKNRGWAGWLLSLGIVAGCTTNDVLKQPLVTMTASAISIPEDNGQAVITFTLDEPGTDEVIIDLVAAGTATENIDFTLSTTVVRIPAGISSATITVQAIQDTMMEQVENVEVTIADITGGLLDGASTVSILIEDDDDPGSLLLILNEICYDPSNNALDGDANGDGRYVQDEDEFVEFVNLSSSTIDLSGYKIFDSEALTTNTPRHVFPAGTLIPAGKAVVVFGGGTPTGSFGNAVVQTASAGRINMNNAGDVMTLTTPDDVVVISFDVAPLSDNPNESYTRNPDITGDFVQHGSVNGVLFSPGTRVDGTPF